MRTIVIGNTTPNTYMRPFVGSRAQITAASLPNGTLAIVTDEAENSIDLTVVYPVGSIYMNATDDTNPGTLFGIGTWSLIDSKFLYGANSLLSDLGDTGGATTATLVQNNLPASLTGLTISAMSGSTSTESTDHTHTVTIADASTQHTHTTTATDVQSGGPTTDGTTTWSVGDYVTHGSATQGVVYNPNGELKLGWNYNTVSLCNHQHKITVPALTTGNMSANDTHSHTNTVSNQSEHTTHSHTVTLSSQTIDLTNSGGGTSFSILPTYRKVAIWVRNS